MMITILYLEFYLLVIDFFRESGHSGSPQRKKEAVLTIVIGANRISKLHRTLRNLFKIDSFSFINDYPLRY